MLYTKGLTHEECGEKTAFEVFKEKRNSLGNLWAKIFVDYKKHGLPVWFSSLDDAYTSYAVYSPQIKRKIAMNSYCRENGSQVLLDLFNILPLDGTRGQVRYTLETSTENGRQSNVYRAKAGRVVNEYFEYLKRMGSTNRCPVSPKMLIYFCERTTDEIKAAQLEALETEYTLKIDEDFQFIYSSANAVDSRSFGSCQCDKGLWDFYNNIVGAKAMSLVNRDGKMLARAIYYTQIHEVNNESVTYRGVERIYSLSSEYKLLMLRMACLQNIVDIYKDVNAGAYDTHLWKKINSDGSETDMKHVDLYVDLKREYNDDDHVAWGDSMRWYVEDDRRLYNDEKFGGDECDNTQANRTFGYLNGWWDEFSERYVSNNVTSHTVNYEGEEIQVTEEERDDSFRYVHGEGWYHEDDVCYSKWADEYYLSDTCVWLDSVESYVRNDDVVDVYTDYESGAFERYPDNHEYIVECEGGYYILRSDSIEFEGHILDINNAEIDIDGHTFRLVEI